MRSIFEIFRLNWKRDFATKAGKSVKKSLITPIPKFASFVPIDAASSIGDYQMTMNFINRLGKLVKLNEIQTESFYSCLNTSHPAYEVLVCGKFPIRESLKSLLKQEYAAVNSLPFAGRGKSLTVARRLAFENLAAAFCKILRQPADLIPGYDSIDLKTGRYLVEFDADKEVVESISSRINQFFRSISESQETEKLLGKIEDKRNASYLTESRYNHEAGPLKGHLPIYSLGEKIMSSVRSNQVTILSATTGSGKTTQVPKMIMNQFLNPSIIVTQPRRMAAISLAERLAHEIDHGPVGHSVGYSVRFQSVQPRNIESQLLFCTSGMLLKKLMSRDVDIQKCTHLVLDEIHERDTNTDILLLAVKKLLAERRDLKVVIMSATLDAQKFYRYFADDGVKTGRPVVLDTPTNFPVKMLYLEDLKFPGINSEGKQYLIDETCHPSDSIDKAPHSVVSSLVNELHSTKPNGSILCFLPGWEDIVAVKTQLEAKLDRQKPFKLFCIHSMTPSDEAQSVFQPLEGIRKIILATNIAESSITIPDVAYVVDSGLQKIMNYKPSLRMNSLELNWISLANSLQRKGRVGRTQPGEYYQLWSKHRHLKPSQEPEILRIGLEDVCLKIKGLGFEGKCAEITQEMIDRPDRTRVRQAVAELTSLGALEPESEDITSLGKALASLPVGPAVGKSLLLASKLGTGGEYLHLASSIGERLLRLPRFEEDRPVFLESLRVLKEHYQDDFEFYLASLSGRDSSNLVHRAALRQVLRVAKSLGSQIGPIPENDSEVARLLWTAALYPNVAFSSGKRNHYILPSRTTAEIPKESILHRDSIEAIIEEGLPQLPLAPSCIAYEELFDAGHKMIVKSTAIDPLALVLFANQFKVEGSSILADNLLVIQPKDANITSLLIDMRRLWKTGSVAVLNCASDDNIRLFKSVLIDFCRLLSTSRQLKPIKV